MNVLLIESDNVLAANLARFFRPAGHKVLHVADAQEAVVLADASRPDVIILELVLAGRSGVEFLYELRSYPDWQKIPVVIYSALPPNEAMLDSSCFEQLDVAGYFYKPATTLSDLLQAVSALDLAVV